MKNVIKLSVVLFAMLGMLFTSCKKDYPEPPIQVLPIGHIYSIGEILDMESGTVFTEDASVYGVVTADEVSGNLYKAAFMQDRTTGKAIELYLNAPSGVRIGDSIRVYLKDVTYALYNGLPQLSNFEADGHIVILANNKPIEPAEATIADVLAGKYLGGLVKLNNVMFTDEGTFADPTGYGNRTLVDPSNLSSSVIVRTSSYANFANDSLPKGPGNLVAIATVYNQTWQLCLRSAGELEFENYHPSGDGSVKTLPYFQSFASDFGSYTTEDVKGAQSWVIDYSTAKMTGYENSINYENEDWLISAPVSFVGANGVSLTMTYIARFFNNLNNDVTIQVSTDYESGDPNDATWKQIPASWVSSSDWTTFVQTTLDLSEFVGDTVRVAVRYLSDNTKAGTIEVQSMAIQEGTGPTPPPGPNPGGEVQNMPYSQSFTSEFGTYLVKDVLGPQSWAIKYESAWISGHEGGAGGSDYDNEDWLISSPVKIEGVDHAKVVLNYAAKYNAPMSQDVTMLVSTDYEWDSDPGTAEWTVVMPNIENNSPGNTWTFTDLEASLDNYIGQTVTVAVKFLSTSNGSRTFEIKNITVQEGQAGGGPTPPPGPGGEVQDMPYIQSFETEFGTYITKNVEGSQSWMIDFSSAKMSGYSGGAFANEDWLISSPVKIERVEHAKVVANYAAKYAGPSDKDITLQVSSNYEYNADPSSAEWVELPVTFVNNNKDWNFNDLEASLDNFLGQTVTVAIKYTSTTSAARTIEVKTISIMEGQAGGGPTPPPGPGEAEGSGTFDDPYNVAAGIGNQNYDHQNHPENTVMAWVRGYIVGSVINGTSSVSSNGDVLWNGPFDSATNVVIADDPNCHEITQCVFVNLPAGKPLRTDVNLKDHPENLGKLLAVYGNLRLYFGQAGLRDSNGQYEDFVLEGSEPPTPIGTVYLNETLLTENSFGTFTTYSTEGEQEWYFDNRYGAVMSGYADNVSYANQDWLISPSLDLSNATNPVLVFDHARGPEQSMSVGVEEGYYTVWVIGDYTGDDPIHYANAEIVGVIHPTVKWQYVSSGELPIPMNLRGADMRIAFKYISADGASATWEIKNVIVKEKE